MSVLRLDVEVTAVDPAGDMVFVEGRAPDGTQLAVILSATLLRGSALAPGQRVQVTLELPSATTTAPAPAPSLRERMTRPATSGAPATARTAAQAAPRAATSTAPPSRGVEAPSAGQAAPRAAPAVRGSDASAGAPARNDTSATLLSFVLGTPSADAGIERDVADEMDALLGRKKRGPGN